MAFLAKKGVQLIVEWEKGITFASSFRESLIVQVEADDATQISIGNETQGIGLDKVKETTDRFRRKHRKRKILILVF